MLTQIREKLREFSGRLLHYRDKVDDLIVMLQFFWIMRANKRLWSYYAGMVATMPVFALLEYTSWMLRKLGWVVYRASLLLVQKERASTERGQAAELNKATRDSV